MQAQYSSTSATYYQSDADICGLFGALSLRGGSEATPSTFSWTNPNITPAHDDSSDSEMSDGMPSLPVHTHACSIPSSIEVSAPPIYHDPSLGCEALQTLQTHIDWHTGVTSASSLLDVVQVHRQAFIASPREHKTCSKALTQLAFALEQRKSEGDANTAVALRYESWLVSGWS